MAALTAGRKTPRFADSPRYYPIAASTTIYAGSLVGLNASGYLVPMAATSTLICVGVASTRGGLDRWDNSAGANGDLNVEVFEGVHRFGNSAGADAIGVTEVGKACYAVDDQTVSKTSSSGTRPIAGIVALKDADGVHVAVGLSVSKSLNATSSVYVQTAYSTANRTVAAPVAATLTDSTTGTASATVAAGTGVQVIALPIDLASITGAGDVLTNYTPGWKFKLLSASFAVSKPVTTAAKAVTLNLEIGITDVTGGSIALTSANCTPLGAVVAGTAITGANTGNAVDTISVEAASVTPFIEGQGYILIKIQNMDTADAAASLANEVNDLITDDLDNRQSVTALIDDLQSAGIVG